jgi:hypothetical protein
LQFVRVGGRWGREWLARSWSRRKPRVGGFSKELRDNSVSGLFVYVDEEFWWVAEQSGRFKCFSELSMALHDRVG